MKRIIDLVQEKPWLGWLIFVATLAVVFLVGLFGASVIERREESARLAEPLKPIADWEPRNEVWGENFPREFETYKSTIDTTFKSKYAGSRTIDYLAENPRLVVLWAGYGFSRDYNQARGHYRAVQDIRRTLRTGIPQPGTCWTCKSTDVPRVMRERGPAEFYKDKWDHLGSEIVNNIGCQDCHNNKTMNLQITRPALIEAFQRQGRNISDATHQEMRTLVCAQCHVEYYFKGKTEKYLTFPWDKGFSADSMEAYYDKSEHADWVHSLSRTPMLKAQHPDYETYMTGVHAERGVSCADCHMPYRSEGGVKFTDHKIQSPLANIASTCGVCHRESEETLRNDVYSRQDKITAIRTLVEDELVRAHLEAKAAWDNGATEPEMKPVLQLIRHAQWRWDWVAAGNGVGIHSPLEAARVLSTALQKAQEARRLTTEILAKHGVTSPVTMPDISTKDKAQRFIGLNPEQMEKDKWEFLRTVVPKWDEEAKARQGKLSSYGTPGAQ